MTMKRAALLTVLFLSVVSPVSKAQLADSSDVYLITCAPGKEIYSVYGHTALRISIRGTGFDRVYNWGIFDFETPNFAFRFAKGRLDYMLGAYTYEDFLSAYVMEKRSVWCQKINLTPDDKKELFMLINENLKPENIKYRYDFFYDNCATRVRDILENAVEDSIVCITEERKKETFRDLINPYQEVLPWLDLGADILLGLQADKKATVREEMFLPVRMMDNMSAAVVMRGTIAEPLLGPAETVVDFSHDDNPGKKRLPQIVFYSVLLFVILVTFVLGIPMLGVITDGIVYILYSVMALLLLFTNIFSEHQALHFNLLIIAVNPLIPVLLVYFLANRKAVTLSRIALGLALLFFPAALIAGQGINPAIVPVVLILAVRLFKRCEFGRSF